MSNSFRGTNNDRFASHSMPAKIDLLDEQPRRESLVERQLDGQMVNMNYQMNNSMNINDNDVPKITVTKQTITTTTNNIITNQAPQADLNNNNRTVIMEQNYLQQQQQQQQASNTNPQQQQKQQPQFLNNSQQRFQQQTSHTINKSNAAALLALELAEKEAKLQREIGNLSARSYSPYKTPDKIDLLTEHWIVQQQYQHAPPSRPSSQASSTRATSADLMEKEAKLMQEIEELESKPYNPQTLVVDRKPRKPGGQTSNNASPTPGSVHTTIIRSPKREIDNKSPLPFAFDNFTTKGIRGNIATVGAVEPDRPRAPIYPIVKRTPSPRFY